MKKDIQKQLENDCQLENIIPKRLLKDVTNTPLFEYIEEESKKEIEKAVKDFPEDPYAKKISSLKTKLEQYNNEPMDSFSIKNIENKINQNAIENDKEFYLEKYRYMLKTKKNKKIKNRYTYSLLRQSCKAAIADLEKQQVSWYFKEIQNIRYKIVELLREYINKLVELMKVLSKLGVTSQGAGLLWCLSRTELRDTDVSTLLQWATYFQNDTNLQTIIRIMGKMKQEIKYTIQETIQIQEEVKHYVKSSSFSGEVTGLKLGHYIPQVLPQEFSILDDEDLEIIFYMKFTESKLLCYETENEQLASSILKSKETITKELTKEELEEKGPVIICVDTSGSMHGTPENIAKALCLAIVNQAVSDDRKCHIINFSTGISTISIEKEMGLVRLINFLKMSFHGGTDVEPALQHAIDMLEQKDYKKADILVISDFIMPLPHNAMVTQIQKAQTQGNKFYSLSIGEFQNTGEGIFDREWLYNSSNHSVHEVLKQLSN